LITRWRTNATSSSSYNKDDQAIVEENPNRLHVRGLTVWLDTVVLPPRLLWQQGRSDFSIVSPRTRRCLANMRS